MFTVMLVVSMFGAELSHTDAYLAGRAAERAGRYGAALEAYQPLFAEESALSGYARVRAAACRAAGGDAEGAIAQYRAVIAQGGGPWARMAQAELAGLLIAQKRQPEAAPLVTSAMGEPDCWIVARRRTALYDGLLENVDTAPAALEYFRGVIATSDSRWARRDAATRLARSTSAADFAVALRVLVNTQNYTDARKLALLLTPSVALDAGPDAAEWRYFQARLRAVGSGKAEDRTALLAIAEEQPPSAWAGPACAWYARNLAKAALDEAKRRGPQAAALRDEADKAFETLSARWPELSEAGDALWWWGNELEDSGEHTAARMTFVQLAKLYPNHDRADDALVNAGDLARAMGDSAGAIELYHKVAEKYADRTLLSEACYRAGALLLEAKKKDAALEDLEKAAAGPLDQFFARRAAARLHGLKGTPLAHAPRLLHGLDGKGAYLGVSPQSAATFTASEPWSKDPRRARLIFFGENGLEEAEWEALGLAAEVMAGGPDTGAVLRDMADAGVALTAWGLADAAGWGGSAGAPTPERLRVLFPRPYWEAVQVAARKHGLDPLLLLAVARQESTFRASVASSAGATGVMQLMPATAQWLQKKEPEFAGAAPLDLTRPADSLRLGSLYLKRMIEGQGGNLAYALAAYNAGPGNLRKWRAASTPKNLDAFIDAIPFSETRHYVRVVLANYSAYSALYGTN